MTAELEEQDTKAGCAEPSRPLTSADAQWPITDMGGITELRVHGIGGTPAAQMLEVLDPIQVSGNKVAGVWRAPNLRQRGIARHLEAYSWGGLTGRGLAGALWVLILPFSLINLAGWMTPRKSMTESKKSWLTGAFRGLIRLIGLCATVFYVLFGITAAMDFAAYQCAGAPDCLMTSWWLIGEHGIAHAPQHRVILGAVGPALLVAALWKLTHRSFKNYESWQLTPPKRNSKEPAAERRLMDSCAKEGLRNEKFWEGQAYARRLAEVHIGVCLCVIAAVVAASALELTTAHCLATGLTGLAGGLALLGLPLAMVSRLRAKLPRYLPSVVGLGLLATTCVLTWLAPAATASPSTLPGVPQAFAVTFGLQLAAAVFLLLAGLIMGDIKHRATSVRKAFTPFAVVVLAMTVTIVSLSGSVLWVARALGVAGREDSRSDHPIAIRYGQNYEMVARALPDILAIFVIAAAIGALGGGIWFARTRSEAARVRLQNAWARIEKPQGWRDEEPKPPAQRLKRTLRFPEVALAAIRWGNCLLAAAIFAFVLNIVIHWFRAMADHGIATAGDAINQPFRWDFLPLSWCTWLLAALPLLAVAFLRYTLTRPTARRGVAMAWDVVTFWPRSFHPLAPPAYAERAVPELQIRILGLLEGTGGKRGSILLLAHSQGTVLVTAALAAMPAQCEADLKRITVVTYGCPLTRLYAASFPAYVHRPLLEEVANKVGHWDNVWRDTDPIGAGEVAAGQGIQNVYLADPPTPWYPNGDQPPPVRGHSEAGYRHQRDFAELVAKCVEDLAHKNTGRRVPGGMTIQPRDAKDSG